METTTTTVITKDNSPKIEISDNSFISIIQDNNGGLSSIRILMLAWGLGVLLIWGFGAIIGIIHGIYVFPSIPSEVVTILLGVTGIKTCQRFAEK